MKEEIKNVSCGSIRTSICQTLVQHFLKDASSVSQHFYRERYSVKSEIKKLYYSQNLTMNFLTFVYPERTTSLQGNTVEYSGVKLG